MRALRVSVYAKLRRYQEPYVFVTLHSRSRDIPALAGDAALHVSSRTVKIIDEMPLNCPKGQ